MSKSNLFDDVDYIFSKKINHGWSIFILFLMKWAVTFIMIALIINI